MNKIYIDEVSTCGDLMKTNLYPVICGFWSIIRSHRSIGCDINTLRDNTFDQIITRYSDRYCNILCKSCIVEIINEYEFDLKLVISHIYNIIDEIMKITTPSVVLDLRAYVYRNILNLDADRTGELAPYQRTYDVVLDDLLKYFTNKTEHIKNIMLAIALTQVAEVYKRNNYESEYEETIKLLPVLE